MPCAKNDPIDPLPTPMPHHDTPAQPIGSATLKEETLTWLLSALGAVAIWGILCTIVNTLYHPDVAALKKMAKDVLIDSDHARPEPVESLLFRLSVILVLPAAILLYKILSGSALIRRVSQTIAFNIAAWGSVTTLALLIYAGMAAWNPYGPKGGDSAQNMRDPLAETNFQFYFKDLFTGDHIWVYLLVIVPLVAVLYFIGFGKKNIDDRKTFQVSVKIVGYITAAFTIIVIVAMNTIHFPYTDENKFDFAAVYYAATQVFSGQPMLVNGFIDTYGLYPHFLLPLFRITGLSVTTFSFTMSLLLGTSLLLNLWMMRKLVKDTTLFFLGFFTLVFFPYLSFKLLTVFDCIFSLYPIRYIIPSVTSILALLYFARPSRFRYYTTFTISSLFILWNPEIGLSCFIAWTFANVYAGFYKAEGRLNLKGMSSHLGNAVTFFVLTLLGYKLSIYLAYGAWPTVGLLFNPIAYFARYGMGLLPMSLLHPWNISALTLLLGFIYAGTAWHHKKITPKSTMVLFLSLVGVGYFTYFQGRSQNSNYALSSGFSLIVLTILADELWTKIRHHRILALNALFVISLCCLSFSFIEIVYNAREIAALSDHNAAREAQASMQERIENNATFIENTTSEGEGIMVIAAKKLQPLLFNGNKRRSVFNPGFIDIFLNSDLDRFENVLIDSANKVYLDPNARIYGFMAPHMAAVAATREYATDNRTMVMLEKRKTRLPAKSFFAGSDLIFHRKYTDDRASIKQRVDDAAGIQKVSPEGSFSISALFHTSLQFTDRPVIVGNLQDSSGFIIGGNNKPDAYVFGVNSSAISVAVPRNTWCYTVMNVSPTKIEVFINGRYMSARHIPMPIRRSTQKMAIGNLGDFHHFNGAIAEVAIIKGRMDSNAVRSLWQKMQPHINAVY